MPELLEVIVNRADGAPTARRVWLGLERQFIGNREHRTMILNAEFCALVQGDLEVTEYCRRMTPTSVNPFGTKHLC